MRELDRKATLQLIHNEHFHKTGIEAIAERQMKIILREFEPFLPKMGEGKGFNDLVKWFMDIMKLKMEFYLADSLYKLGWVPPGIPFDPKTMEPFDDLQILNIREPKNYRVKMSLFPSLVVGVKEPNWSTRTVSDAEGETYTSEDFREALVTSRDFLPEMPGMWRAWDGALVISKIRVLVEEIPSAASASKGKQPAVVDDDEKL